MEARTAGQRAGLTRASVLAAARKLLEESGGDTFSMRSLATRLGVTPNALYSHVENKAALIDQLLDDTLAEVQIPPPGGDPSAELHALMASTYEVLLAHGQLVQLFVARQGARGAHAHQLGEAVLAFLARAGVEPPEAQQALHVLIVFALGAAAFSSASPLAQQLPAGERASRRRVEYGRGLQWLIAGIMSPSRNQAPALAVSQ